MDTVDFSQNGGLPLEQDTLDFLQLAYKGPLEGIAKLCGDKTILSGVVQTGSNISAGWISYEDELILFQGCTHAAQVAIVETPISVTFEDGTLKETYFLKVAVCAAVGEFLFSDLVPLLSLQNIWRPGNIKEHYCDNAYIAANFVAGVGINEEKGWAILSVAFPATAGRTFVNYNPADPLFDTLGDFGGAKTHTLTQAELPNVSLKMFGSDVNAANGDLPTPVSGVARAGQNGGDYAYEMRRGGGDGSGATLGNTSRMGNGEAHSIMNPYFVILKLVKI